MGSGPEPDHFLTRITGIRDVDLEAVEIRQAGTPHQRNIHERNAQTLRGTIESYVTTLLGLSILEMAVVRAVLPPPT